MYKQCIQLIDSHFAWKVNKLKINYDKNRKVLFGKYKWV